MARKFCEKEARIIEEIAEGAMDILVPRLSEFYDVEMVKPLLKVKPDEDMPKTRGYFRSMRIEDEKVGIIGLNARPCMIRRQCCSTTAHELGHAAVYQNRDEENIYKIGHFKCLEEGIAMDFASNGLNVLAQENYINLYEKYRQKLGLILYPLHDLFFTPDEYSIGYMLVKGMKGRGVKVKDLIIQPREYEDEIEMFVNASFPD